MDKGKRNTLIIAIALVALIGGGAFAYQTLQRTQAASTAASPPLTTETAAVGSDAANGIVTESNGTNATTTPGATSTGNATATTNPTETAEQPANHGATVYTESGEPRTIAELANSKPLVVNIWATWCPYCVEEMPDFKEIYNEYKDRVSFAFIDSADGQRETVEEAAEWLRENDLAELPAYYDTNDEAAMLFGAYSLPTTAIVSADGRLVSSSAGIIDPEQLRATLDTLVQ